MPEHCVQAIAGIMIAIIVHALTVTTSILMSVPRKDEASVYEFGPFRLDTAERLLLREGEVVPLPPKVIETLLVLVENNGHVLEKDDLIKMLWPDTFVEEGSLSRNISYLRRALGENGSAQPYIETIPRRGYRFVASVKVLRNDQQDLAKSLANFSATGSSQGPHHNLIQGVIHDAGLVKSIRSAPPVKAVLDQPRRVKRRALVIASIAVVLMATAWGLGRGKWNRPASDWASSTSKLRLDKLTHTGQARLPVLSSDGKYVAYVQDDAKGNSIWIRQTANGSQVQIVPPADAFYRGLTFSRDDNYLYYVVYEKEQTVAGLYQISILGGVAQRIIHDIDSPVAFSPDGRQVAFIRDYLTRGESALLIANVDGSQEKTLATRRRPYPFLLTGPDWSPDGQIIACAARHESDKGSFNDIVLVKVKDGTAKPLTLQQDGQKWFSIGQLAWLKDGSGLLAVAWHERTSTFSDQVWYFPYPSGEPQRVTNDANTYAGLGLTAHGRLLVTSQFTREMSIQIAPGADPARLTQIASGRVGAGGHIMLGVAWAPDGRSDGAIKGTPGGRIVYSSDANGRSDIWIMDADGGNQRQLTDDAPTDLSPTVSPDGRYVAFVSYRDGNRNLWRIDIDGRNLRQLTNGPGEDAPSFSPDGKWIVYDSFSGTKPTLWKVPVDCGAPVQLTDFNSFRPVVSPDGKWVAFYAFDHQAMSAKIGLLPFESGASVSINHAPIKAFTPLPILRPPLLHWAADGRSLIYSLTRAEVSNLWRQPFEGSSPSQITSFTEGRIFSFAISRDGNQFVCERGKVMSDVVLINNLR